MSIPCQSQFKKKDIPFKKKTPLNITMICFLVLSGWLFKKHITIEHHGSTPLHPLRHRAGKNEALELLKGHLGVVAGGAGEAGGRTESHGRSWYPRAVSRNRWGKPLGKPLGKPVDRKPRQDHGKNHWIVVLFSMDKQWILDDLW